MHGVLLALWLFFITGVVSPARAASTPGSARPTAEWRAAPVAPEPAVMAPSGGWWTEDGLYARVHAAPADRGVARALADHAATAVPRLAAELGVPAGGAMEIYVAPSTEDFARMQPGTPPEWADGTAWPEEGLIFLRSPRARGGATTPLTQVLDHEVVHILLGRAFAVQGRGPQAAVPHWLQEGMARLMAREYGPEGTRTLAESGSLPRLSELTSGFPRSPAAAQVAYAASADFLAFVQQEHGEGSVHALVARMSRGEDAGQALQAATGRSLAELEAAWRDDWRDPLWWSHLVATSSSIGWTAGALAIAGGAWRVRRRNRGVLARWSQQEAQEEARRAAEQARAAEEALRAAEAARSDLAAARTVDESRFGAGARPDDEVFAPIYPRWARA
jgi:hypothetical protein